jgi:hypothetical protein
MMPLPPPQRHTLNRPIPPPIPRTPQSKPQPDFAASHLFPTFFLGDLSVLCVEILILTLLKSEAAVAAVNVITFEHLQLYLDPAMQRWHTSGVIP